MINLVQLMDI